MQKPGVGRIVHYYQGDHEAPSHCAEELKPHWRGMNGTRIHPAIITHVHSDECVNLVVFLDGTGQKVVTSVCRLPDEVFAEGMHCTRSGWRWPERV